MKSVTFYEDIDYNGNSRTYDIGVANDYQILLYEDANTPLEIRSIKNNTSDYFIVLNYRNNNNPFGGNFFYINDNLWNIQLVRYIHYTGGYQVAFQEISPYFYGIMLQKILPQKTYVFNYVIKNFFSSLLWAEKLV